MYKPDDLISATPHAADSTSPPDSPGDTAVRLLEIATRSADELLDEAKSEAAALVATARAEADQLTAASQAEADQLTASARAEADQLLTAAHREAKRVHAELEEKRSQQQTEIARLEQLERDHKHGMRSHLSELLSQIDPTSAD